MFFLKAITLLIAASTTVSSLPTPQADPTPDPILSVVIPPSNSTGDQPRNPPAGSTLVLIGFQSQLNYKFVFNTPAVVPQIYTTLPLVLSTALAIPKDDVLVYMLEGYDTQESKGYLTTIAMVYIPESRVKDLQDQLDDDTSRLFTGQEDQNAKTIAGIIDKKFPLLLKDLPGGDKLAFIPPF